MNVLGLVVIAAACMILLALASELEIRWKRRKSTDT